MNETYAIDFDGPIHRYGKGWFDGTIYDEPVPGAFDAIRLLMQRGAVFIHTSRDANQVGRWLEEHGGFIWTTTVTGNAKFWTMRGVLLITSRKYPAKWYVDDRAHRFTSWGLALAELLPQALASLASLVDEAQVSVSADDLRRVVQLAQCHADTRYCEAQQADLAALQRVLAQVGGKA